MNKGLTLPITVVIVVVIVVLLLVIVGTFFLSTATIQMSAAEAQEVYAIGCNRFCGIDNNIYEEGALIDQGFSDYETRQEDLFRQKFKRACKILGHLPSDLELERASGIINCLTTCGNCYINPEDTQQGSDIMGNLAQDGIDEGNPFNP
ncbi:hypothetical protein ACFLQN_02515 [Candidatus Aenigmatarchaeota archaeon]